MDKRFDLIVIGSGPAGSACAITAARAGLDVAVIDKAAFPREKLCGGGVTGRSLRYLADIFALAPTEDLFLPSSHVRLCHAGRLLGESREAPVIQMTMRRAFDARLHALAQAAGATVFAPARITALDPDTGTVTLATGQVLNGAVLVGADGANSLVARSLFGRAFDPQRIGFGLEAELDRSQFSDNVTEIDLGAAAWGYGWVFPKTETVTLGVGGIHALNPDMKARFHSYLHQHAPHLAKEGKIACKGAFLPFGDYRKQPGRGRVLLAGDAAGLVDPITGEGIAWALKSGQFAGEAAAEALRGGGVPALLPAYLRRLSYIHREMAAARRIRALIYARPFRSVFPATLERHPGMTQSYLRLLSGERDYADLGPAVLWRLARRLGSSLIAGRARPRGGASGP